MAVLVLDCSIKDNNLIFVSKNGLVKITKASEYFSSKHIISAIKLAKSDELIMVDFYNSNKKLCMFTSLGNAVKIETQDISITGRVSAGVKGVALDKTDYVVSAIQTVISDAFTMYLSDGYAKIVKQNEVPESERNRKGLAFMGAKSKNAKILYVGKLSVKTNYVIETDKNKLVFVYSNALPLDTRTGQGKIIVKDKIRKVYPFNENK